MEKTYKSNYTDQPITAAQFLAETMCERIAKKNNKVLKYKFWTEPEYKKIFQRQIVAANQLLKEIDVKDIMNFLRSKNGKNIYSLGLKAPILAGCKSKSFAEYNPIESSPMDDGFMSDSGIEPSSTIKDSYEKEFVGKNLWGKLQ